MSGYVMAHGPCICCGRLFSFNPLRVPSSRALTGEREPICRSCFAAINMKRAAMKLPPFEMLAGAYDPLPEAELGDID